MRVHIWAAALVACGGGSTPATTLPQPDPCELAQSDAQKAARALESCLADAGPMQWPECEAFTWLGERVDSRLVALRNGTEPVTTTIVEAQEIAEHVWALLDTFDERGVHPASRERVEQETEVLLRETGADARERALVGLAVALAALRSELEPPIDARCELERGEHQRRALEVGRVCPLPLG